MDESELLDKIKQSLLNKGLHITEKQAKFLYSSVLSEISKTLNKGDIVSISDFGSFRKKNTESLSAVSFMPSDNILKRINERK